MAKAKAQPKRKTTAKKTVKAPTTKAKARPTEELLGAAREAVRAGKFGDALAALLDAWRGKPAPAIADAIDAIGARAMAELAPPSGATTTAKNAAWDKAAKGGDPAMRGVLLATLTDTKGNAETLARLELLVPWRDPRVATRIVELIERPVYNASVNRTRTFWKRLWALVPELGDARVLPRLAVLDAGWRRNPEVHDAERNQLRRDLLRCLPLAEEAYAAPPELTPIEAAVCVNVVADVPKPSSTSVATADAIGELLRAVYEAPDDDGPRLVLADVLQQRGDPRGELIALQLVASPTREQQRRVKALLAEHAGTWLGPLAPLVKKTTARFERGFLAACEIKDGHDVSRDPSWATVRELAGAAPLPDVAMPALRVLRDIRARDIVRLRDRATPLAIEHLHWRGPDMWLSTYYPEHDAKEREGIAAFRMLQLPALRRLELALSDAWWDEGPPAKELAWSWTSPCTARLEHLTLGLDPAGYGGVVAALAPTSVTEVAFVAPHGNPAGWRATFRRDADGVFSHLAVTVSEEFFDDILGARFAAGIATLPARQLTVASIDAPEPARSVFVRGLASQKRVQIPELAR